MTSKGFGFSKTATKRLNPEIMKSVEQTLADIHPSIIKELKTLSNKGFDEFEFECDFICPEVLDAYKPGFDLYAKEIEDVKYHFYQVIRAYKTNKKKA